MILFGTHRAGEFILDTAFVVAGHFEYSRKTHRSLRVPELYHNAALAPIFAGRYGGNDVLRLYEGVTPTNPVAGMFSFFPCLPADESKGFARPAISLSGIVDGRLMRGIKRTTVSIGRACELWRSVTKQVLDQGLCLGTAAAFPRPYHGAIPSASQTQGAAGQGCTPAKSRC